VTLHGAPSSAELLEAVREWLERDVMTSTEGRLRFHARVAANVIATVERELALGNVQGEAHRERLASLGVADDAELAQAIRSGDLDDQLDAVRAVLRVDVDDRLSVANPKYPDQA
jgi:hypothetical protein